MQETYLGFTTKNRLRHHCATEHPETLVGDIIAGRPFPMHSAKCYYCRISFKFVRELREHLKIKHNYDPETVSLNFISLLAFEKWKNELEGKTYAKYRKQCGNKKGLHYYVCSCSAIGVQYSPRQKKFNVVYKTHESCTSQIVVSNRDGIQVVFHAGHYGHAPVPVDSINEFYAINELTSDDKSTITSQKLKGKFNETKDLHSYSKLNETAIDLFLKKRKSIKNFISPKVSEKLKEERDKRKDLYSYSKLNKTVLDLFQTKIKSTTNDIENEIIKLMGKEISCDMAESLKSAWDSIKTTKMKLIEANALGSVKKHNETKREERETLKRKRIDINENIKRTKKFDSISIINGSIRLRCYDDKYKGNDDGDFEIEEDRFDNNYNHEYESSNHLTFPLTNNALLEDPSECFNYDDFLKEFNVPDSKLNEINVPIL